jgi:hypothetical protein
MSRCDSNMCDSIALIAFWAKRYPFSIPFILSPSYIHLQHNHNLENIGVSQETKQNINVTHHRVSNRIAHPSQPTTPKNKRMAEASFSHHQTRYTGATYGHDIRQRYATRGKRYQQATGGARICTRR